MNDLDGVDPAEFAAAFKQFVENMNIVAAKESAPLLERLKECLGPEPGQVPVVAEEFESYVQVALDAVLPRKGRQVELIGIAAAKQTLPHTCGSRTSSGSGAFTPATSASGPYARSERRPRARL